jgi:hypothetical protein
MCEKLRRNCGKSGSRLSSPLCFADRKEARIRASVSEDSTVGERI